MELSYIRYSATVHDFAPQVKSGVHFAEAVAVHDGSMTETLQEMSVSMAISEQ